MQNSSLVPPTFHFGLFELNPQSGELRKNGMKIRLQGQPVEILLLLLQRPGEVITREELQKKLWPADTFVDFEQGLNNAIKRLRAALDDDSENPHFIETVPRRGYRFISSVTQTPPVQGALAATGNQVVEVADANQRQLVEKKNEKSAPHRTLRTWWVALGAGCLIATAGISWISYLMRPPRVLEYKQLTKDRRVKNPACGNCASWVLSDGPRVFFAEPGASIVQVASSGGDVVTMPHPSKFFIVWEISPDKTELLGGTEDTSTNWNMPIWVLSLMTGQARRLGDLLGHAAAWSPDGQRIVYAVGDDFTGSQGNDVYVAGRDGSEARKLTRLERGFVRTIHWSPDGTVLRMRVFQKGSCSTWEVSADGTNLHILALLPTNHTGCWWNWTPDGRYSLLTVDRSPKVGTDIWVVPESRWFHWHHSEPTQLTTGPMIFVAPAPSPDGKQIYAIGAQLYGELLRYDLRSQRLEPYLSGISADQPNFSRDGKWIAYVLFPEGTLWRSKVDGSERLQLTTSSLIACLPSWSPDGKRIAFTGILPANLGFPTGHFRTYVVSAEGGQPEMVSTGEDDELDPTWTPDGNSLIVGGSSHSARTRISAIDLRTRHVSVIPGSEGMRSPSISPDGRYILAIDSQTDAKFLLFNQQTQKWTLLVHSNTLGIGWPKWSGDSRYVYFTNWARSPTRVLDRVRVTDGKIDHVAEIDIPEGLTGLLFGGWITPTPDGSPILLRNAGSQEIYSLEVDLP